MTSLSAEHVRWRWILPVLASTITILLLVTFLYERKPGATGFTTPSMAIEEVLNFPTIVLLNVSQINSLLYHGISGFPLTWQIAIEFSFKALSSAAFWGWVGWIIDTQERQLQFSSTGMRRIWACIYALAIISCVLVVGVIWRDRHFLTQLSDWARSFMPGWEKLFFPRFVWLRTNSFVECVGSLWFVAGAIYFAKKAFRLWQSSIETGH